MEDLRAVLRRLKFAFFAVLLLGAGIGFSRFFYQDDDFSIAATNSPKMAAERATQPGPKVDYTAVGVAKPHKPAKAKRSAPAPDAD